MLPILFFNFFSQKVFGKRNLFEVTFSEEVF